MGAGYIKRKNFSDFIPRYTDTYTKDMDEEGLTILKWSMFDSPDKLGSGKKFMESEPVWILDEVFPAANHCLQIFHR